MNEDYLVDEMVDNQIKAMKENQQHPFPTRLLAAIVSSKQQEREARS